MNAAAWQSLLEVSNSILEHRDIGALFRSLAPHLRRVLPFDFIAVVLHDPSSGCMRLHVLESNTTAEAPRSELPVSESPAGWVMTNQQALLVDVAAESRWPRVLDILRENRIGACCFLPLTTAHRQLGALSFGYVGEHAIRADELEFMGHVAAQVAVAVDNSLNAAASLEFQRQLAHDRDRLRALLEITNAMVSHLALRELFAAITACLRRVVPHEYSSLALHEPGDDCLVLHALEFETGSGSIEQDARIPIEGSLSGSAFRGGKPLVLATLDTATVSSETGRLLAAEGLRSACIIPLVTRNRTLGTVNLASVRENAFSAEDVEFLTQIAAQASIALENAQTYREIEGLKNKLADEKLYLQDEIRSERNFGDIIGDSAAFRRVLGRVEIVAPTDATVLILGETGTGKELIARSLHDLSARKDRTFVKVNCAAIPGGLLESELFGHERGAFTGAIAQRIGRFELADCGTLFLDEVGDIPLDLQSKLLRALQEQEFERLGSARTIRVNVRLIAATNRDLARMVAEQQFRADLYYRLNVFPVRVPALRERPADIPMLLRYFVEKCSRRLNKRIDSISPESMQALIRYSWPGNVRELENIVERAVILSRGPSLDIPVTELGETASLGVDGATTLETAERSHILRALEATAWKLSGPDGAAARLGMKRTTLQSKMKKLGIARPRYAGAAPK